MEDFLRRNPIGKEGELKPVDNVNPHKRVAVNPDLPKDVLKSIWTLLENHKAAFQTTETGLCKPLKVPPVRLKIKPGAKLPKVPPKLLILC